MIDAAVFCIGVEIKAHAEVDAATPPARDQEHNLWSG